MTQPITTSSDWTLELIERFYKEIETIAIDELGLDVYPNQIEIISAEQMLDAYCITPDHRILKRDLRWTPAGEIQVGDIVLGFDENGISRSYKEALVERVEFQDLPVYEVILDSGKKFKVTENHLWLVHQQEGKNSVLLWKSTRQLRGLNDPSGHSPSRIPKVLDVWEEDDSEDANWLAEMYNKEKDFFCSSVQDVFVSQDDETIQDKIKSLLKKRGQDFHITNKSEKCNVINLKGTIADKLKFLGEIRPNYLISKISFDKFGLMEILNYENVISVNPIGIQTIVKITTSTGTFVCDGYPMHNSSVGMPVMYNHWSFGKEFIENYKHYKQGRMGLAYEIVLNTNPCLVYLMEENTMMMQGLVMAHAAFGHNAFFKSNYMFKEWTQADSIVDYLVFAKNYIAECEEKYGARNVEILLDACHALQKYGVDRYKRHGKLSVEKEITKQKQREQYIQSQLNDIWRTIPSITKFETAEKNKTDRFPSEPQENILYFIEKNAPKLETWQREIIRIVRKISQYFYPQSQTKVMNEGFATFIHYIIMNRLREKGLITDGFMMEFIREHTNVIFQPSFDSKWYNGINPYALGFAIFQDIRRICENPTEEDRQWFPDIAGNPDWITVIKHVVANFKDDSFILQFLSPKVIRNFRLFALKDLRSEPEYKITAIHNNEGFKHIRRLLAKQHDPYAMIPDIQVVEVDRWGDRRLILQHTIVNGRLLERIQAERVLALVRTMWKYDVILNSVDSNGVIKETFAT